MSYPAWRDCDRCNYDLHTCPGCGENLPHGIDVCDVCREAGHTLTPDPIAPLIAAHRAIAEQARADGDHGRANLHDWAADQAQHFWKEQTR